MSTVKAQLPGVFYRRPAPESEPYVREGGHVDPGQTVAVIESVKTYNAITSDHAGTAIRFLLSDGDQVDEGQDILEVTDD